MVVYYALAHNISKQVIRFGTEEFKDDETHKAYADVGMRPIGLEFKYTKVGEDGLLTTMTTAEKVVIDALQIANQEFTSSGGLKILRSYATRNDLPTPPGANHVLVVVEEGPHLAFTHNGQWFTVANTT